MAGANEYCQNYVKKRISAQQRQSDSAIIHQAGKSLSVMQGTETVRALAIFSDD